MNNRIFEIIQGINGQVGLQWDEEDKEELAVLIVKECCDIVRQCRFAPDEDAIVNEIVHHFGVEL